METKETTAERAGPEAVYLWDEQRERGNRLMGAGEHGPHGKVFATCDKVLPTLVENCSYKSIKNDKHPNTKIRFFFNWYR